MHREPDPAPAEPAVGGLYRMGAIEASLAIWREFHEPLGITLAESKSDWLELLNEDPEMVLDRNWGDLAGRVRAEEIVEFRAWLTEGEKP